MRENSASDASAFAQGERVSQGRPSELEDWLNGSVYHPLSMRLAKALIPTPVTPNMVSIVGGVAIVTAAVAYWFADNWVVLALGLALHMSWHVFDGADGDLARLTGRTSARGEIIDGVCDYAGHIVLYVTLGFMLMEEIGGWAAWSLAIGAGIGRIVQAAHYEVQRRQYQYWVYGTKWLRVSDGQSDQPNGILGGVAIYYMALAKLLAPGGREVDHLVEQSDDEQRDALRLIIRTETIPVLRSTYLLSANFRTIVCGLSMLAGSPLYFFVFEALGLTCVMAVSILTASTATQRIQDQANNSR
ncbi:CDP-alcohol phosphatidyltransferase family protein [uncultured Erythrobacter sp.]|uniref:CDP-alcohol phosphatidyltransferase family protein n=1 Tax=uncultured Erythrobacter sp. TaxID=263913 RepID=UPI00262838E6|nr:CDP-alcohol phosphatidyltransferase family protein [uncultured Erythrobacter sp.]